MAWPCQEPGREVIRVSMILVGGCLSGVTAQLLVVAMNREKTMVS